MKFKNSLLAITLFSAIVTSKAQNLNNVVNTISNGVNNNINNGAISNTDAISGLKEALKVGSNNSVEFASKLNGFYKNVKIKIPFPTEAKNMEAKLRSIGMGAQCDKFIETLNRGAEEAAKSAAPIFADAITKITITDGLKILNGVDNAATIFLKDNTTAQLKITFLPVVKSALKKVEITKAWSPLATAYDKIPFVQKVNPDLNVYVTDKAIDGLFKLIADEEYKIRKDPTARVNDILKKVFGSIK